jgi:hypothetical protein
MKINKLMVLLLIVPLFLIISSAILFTGKTEKIMETSLTLNQLPIRKGTRPQTTNTNPHTQLTQQPENLSHIKALMNWAFTLNYIKREPSAISVPGAIAMCMEDEHTCEKCNAFMIGTEFAHFHPHPDYSMHLGLPTKDAEAIIEKGWGEWHPLIKRGFLPPNIIMMYAPRNEEELEVAKFILGSSYHYAKGE